MLATLPALIAALVVWLVQQLARGLVLFPPEIGRAFKQAEVTLIKWEKAADGVMTVTDGVMTYWWVPLVMFALWFLRSRQS